MQYGAPGAGELHRENRELAILNTFARALNASVDLDELLADALAQVAELLGLRTGWVLLLAEATCRPYMAAGQNLPPGLTADPERMTGRCYCLDTFCRGDLGGAANVNVVTCSRLKQLVDGTDGLRYHASIPLYARGKRLGMLNVVSPDWRQLGPDELRLLNTIGDMLGIAIERARLHAASHRAGVTEERNRLAREIHDTLAQGLTAIALQLEAAEALLDQQANPERVRRATTAALALARENLEEARRSVFDLRAAPLEGRTLPQALLALAAEATEAGGVRVAVETNGDDRPLPSRIEAGLYRIAQEALTNALRHASAERISVHLIVRRDRVRLILEDDGIGFDPDRTSEGRFGLVGVRERTRLLRGDFSLESSPGAGTRVEVNVPLTGDSARAGIVDVGAAQGDASGAEP